MLFYKVGFHIPSWQSALMTSTDGGMTWSEPRILQDRTYGPVKNKPIQLADGTILCGSSDEANGWQVFFSMTNDLGTPESRPVQRQLYLFRHPAQPS